MLSKGTASSMVSVPDAATWLRRPGVKRHAAIRIHADGSGGITIYHKLADGKVIERGSISVERDSWLAIRDAIDSQIRGRREEA